MTAQPKAVWKNPGVMAFLAVIVLANFVVDFWLFKPENVVAFLIADAAIIGGIVFAASRRRPPDKGDGGANSGDVANLVP